jgi:hypothetical protein
VSFDVALKIFGIDPNRVLMSIKICPNIESKIKEIDSLMNSVKRTAKLLLAKNHPDRNPGNNFSTNKFIEVQRTFKSLEFHINNLREKAVSMQKQMERCNSREGSIKIGN